MRIVDRNTMRELRPIDIVAAQVYCSLGIDSDMYKRELEEIKRTHADNFLSEQSEEDFYLMAVRRIADRVWERD